MEAKEKLQLEILTAMRNMVDETQLQILKSTLESKMYNYSVREIKNTELAVYEGSKTDKLWDYFSMGKLSSKKQPETVAQYRRVAYQLVDLVHKELDEITKEDVKYFLIKYPQINKVSDATMDCKRRYLSSLFSYLFSNEIIEKNPMASIEVVKYKKVVKQPLKDEEIQRIKMSCVTPRDNAIVTFFLETGVRVSELCGISLCDVDFTNYKVKVLGKGNKERFVYFTGKGYVLLLEYLKTRKDIDMEQLMYGGYSDSKIPLFASTRKNHIRLTKNAVEQLVNKLRKPSGVTRLHCHLFRATYATNLAKKGVSIELIAKSLGHANLNTISRYVLTGDDELQLALKRTGSAA